MLIFLMRHGVAVDRDDPDYPDDASRPLTRHGVKRTARIARGLRRMDVSIDRLVTSPLYRCRQTADVVAKEFGFPTSSIIETLHLAPGGSPLAFVQELFVDPAPTAVMAVGHQPDLSELISLLIAGDPHAIDIPLKKGAVALVECDNPPSVERGTLHFLLQPSMLRRLCK